jgi:hypothetical protein
MPAGAAEQRTGSGSNGHCQGGVGGSSTAGASFVFDATRADDAPAETVGAADSFVALQCCATATWRKFAIWVPFDSYLIVLATENVF